MQFVKILRACKRWCYTFCIVTISQIKVLAVITMVIDHVGLFFFPQFEIMRTVGRIAFPLFAWLIANGAYHTRDIRKYILRLFGLALVSQIPFTLANQTIGSPLFYLNVVFTLCFGLIAIYVIKSYKSRPLSILATTLMCIAANSLHTDYGAFGVLSIVFFYAFFNNKRYLIVSQALIFLLPILTYYAREASGITIPYLYEGSLNELFGLLSLFFILHYDSKKPPKGKSFFYYFYPLQYVAIYLLKLIA
jgi:ABC-type thiamin/hydroxymethylpyrimidine transport system permease subunit